MWLEELGKECGKEFGTDHEGPPEPPEECGLSYRKWGATNGVLSWGRTVSDVNFRTRGGFRLSRGTAARICNCDSPGQKWGLD